jgi:hypothetical protein
VPQATARWATPEWLPSDSSSCHAGRRQDFIHVSDGKLHDVHALDLLLPEAGAIYAWIAATSISPASMGCISPAPSSSTRAKSNMIANRVYSAPTDRATGIICGSDHRARRSLHQPALPRTPRQAGSETARPPRCRLQGQEPPRLARLRWRRRRKPRPGSPYSAKKATHPDRLSTSIFGSSKLQVALHENTLILHEFSGTSRFCT